jgi:hypothetical protein
MYKLAEDTILGLEMWYDIHTKFNENSSIISKLSDVADTRM